MRRFDVRERPLTRDILSYGSPPLARGTSQQRRHEMALSYGDTVWGQGEIEARRMSLTCERRRFAHSLHTRHLG